MLLRPPAPTVRRITTAGALLAGALLVAGVAYVRLALTSFRQLTFPHDLNFESPNLATIRLIQQGTNPFDPAVFADLPFVWTLYTPLYHALAALWPASGDNPFAAGRGVVLVSLLVIVAAVVATPTRSRLRWLALAAGGLLVASGLVTSMATMLRNDLPALAFAAGAVVLAARSATPGVRHRNWWIAAAGVCAVLAVATKQSYVAGGLAIGLWLLATDPGRLWRVYAPVGGGGLLLAAGGATVALGPGFWTSVLNTGSHPWEVAHALFVAGEFLPDVVAPATIAVAAAVLTTVLARKPRWFGDGPYGSYLVVSLGVLVATLPKVGSSTNYFLEPLVASVLWLVWVVDRRDPQIQSWTSRGGLVGLAALAALVLATAPEATHSYLPRRLWHERVGEQDRVGGDPAATRAAYVREVSALVPPGSRILNLATPQFTYERNAAGLLLQDRAYLNDPFLYAAILGRSMPVDPLVHALERRDFALVIMPLQPHAGMDFDPAIAAAVRDAYRPAGQGVFAYAVPAP